MDRGKITIRPIVAADAVAVAEMHTISWRSAYRGMLRDQHLDGDTPRNAGRPGRAPRHTGRCQLRLHRGGRDWSGRVRLHARRRRRDLGDAHRQPPRHAWAPGARASAAGSSKRRRSKPRVATRASASICTSSKQTSLPGGSTPASAAARSSAASSNRRVEDRRCSGAPSGTTQTGGWRRRLRAEVEPGVMAGGREWWPAGPAVGLQGNRDSRSSG